MRNPTLRDKFYGCIAASFVGSAMGAAAEGRTWQEVRAAYGDLDRMLPYEHYGNGWARPAGTTEDGVERQKRFAAAIFERQGRVTCEQVARSWLARLEPESMRMLSEPFELQALEMARVGVPARDLGGYIDFTAHVAYAASCQPIALINAGDVDSAIEDHFEVGQLYQSANSKGLMWASVVTVAIATATTPGATLDDVLAAIYDRCHPAVVLRELDRHLKATEGMTSVAELRDYFDGIYGGSGVKYPFSYANEVVIKAIAILRIVGSDARAAVLAGAGFGRDASSTAAIVAGISGALGGADLPTEWTDTVDRAALENPYTLDRRSLRDFSDALYDVFTARLVRRRAYIEEMANA